MTITLEGWTLLILLMAIGGYVGWRRGIREFLTITLVSALAYLILVIGANPIISYVNNLYINIPKLLEIFMGGNPDTVAAWQPLGIAEGLPLAVRVVLFVALVILAFIFNQRPTWYSAKASPQSKQLGIFTGALTALIWTSTFTTFWQEAASQGNQLPDPFGTVSSLPDVTSVAPWLIILLFLIVVASIFMNLPKLWKP